MHDPWTDRLSEYMDGEMAADEARRLEEHLASCDACADTLAGLADVVAEARALEDRPPAADLWPGIAAGIAAGAALPGDVVAIDSRRPRAARSFTFSVPQLAAAAMLLMALSAGTAWLVTQGAQGSGGDGGAVMMAEGTIFQSVNPPSPTTRLVDTRPADAAASASLVELLDEARESLDPATVEVLERSIASIQEAIEAAESALAADPGNPRLQRQLDSTLQRRDEFAQRVSRVRAGA